MGILESISWQHYLIGVVTVITGYYLFIGIRYYRKDLSGLLQGKSRFGEEDEADFLEYEDDEEQKPEQENNELLHELELLVNDIRAGILEKAGKEATKEQLLEQLQEKVAGFGGLHRPAYRYALNNYIIQHFQKQCGVAFSEEELDAAWESLPR